MPDGTVSLETKRYELDSLPEAFVVVRKFSYGETIHLQDIGAIAKGSPNEDDVSFEMRQEAIIAYEFAKVIMEHNITDGENNLLNFRNRADLARLDPVVGMEIESCIDDWNEAAAAEVSKRMGVASQNGDVKEEDRQPADKT